MYRSILIDLDLKVEATYKPLKSAEFNIFVLVFTSFYTRYLETAIVRGNLQFGKIGIGLNTNSSIPSPSMILQS